LPLDCELVPVSPVSVGSQVPASQPLQPRQWSYDAWKKCGINVHYDYGGNIGATPYTEDAHQFWRPGYGNPGGYTPNWKQRLIELGVKVVRCGGKPWLDGNAFGIRQLLEAYDDAKAYDGVGIQHILGMGIPNVDDPAVFLERVNDQYNRAVVGDTTSAWVPRVIAVEAANEPNFNGAAFAATSAQLAALWTARNNHANVLIRTLPILGPSVAGGNEGDYFALGNVSQYFDVANSHPYSGGYDPARNLTLGRSRLNRFCAGLPFAFTEGGFHTAYMQATAGQPHPGVPPDVHAIYTLQTFLESIRLGAVWVIPYELLDQWNGSETNPSENGEAHFGLVGYGPNNGTNNWPTFPVKPAYTATQRLMSLLRDDASPVGTEPVTLSAGISPGNDVRSLSLARADGSTRIWLWRNAMIWDRDTHQYITDSPQSTTITFNNRPNKLTRYNLMTSVDPIDVATASTISIQVGASPICLEVR
jgi:hypothetical protein